LALQDETARLHALRQLKLLDTPSSDGFDRITRMAAKLFDLSMAAISLTDHDRQWFKSRVGLDQDEAPRLKAPCAVIAERRELLVIPDLLDSYLYADSAMALAGIRFYAGAPLVTREGYGLGALCVLGREPRQFTDEERDMLSDLAAMTMAQIDLQHAFGRIDPTSGLPNRHRLLEDLRDQAAKAELDDRALVIMETMDAARLRDALRVLGPEAVDEHVHTVARALEAVLGPDTTAYHVGRVQLAWVAGSWNNAGALLERLRERVELTAGRSAAQLLANPALGVAPFRIGGIAPEDLLRSAYMAEQDARDRETLVGIYSAEADREHRRRFRLLSDMRAALDARDQLSLAFQPRIDLRSGACVGAEALLRWQHPVLGQVPPGEFIPMVEQTDLVGPLTEWVVETALRQALAWRTAGLAIPISLNVSAANLEEPSFAARLVERLSRANLPPDAIEIEVTESAAVRDGTRAGQQLHELRAAGIRVAIDDFGTGYSTLAYLRTLPADVVKIDQSFIRELHKSERAQTLVRAMIRLAQSLNFRVVAEGVEDQESFDLLCSFACDEVQGYLVSRPLPPADLELWRRKWEPPGITLAA
jgi:EAL domain-containing protein (putative c-di-GMP-specific phosphodiesterase class I)/GGDEF domain-containing protein